MEYARLPSLPNETAENETAILDMYVVSSSERMPVETGSAPDLSENVISLAEVRQVLADIHVESAVSTALVNDDATKKELTKRYNTPTTHLIAPPEQAKKPSFKLRGATPEDIDAIVEVDINSFDSVYSSYEIDRDELREELRDKFRGRLEKVGSEWMPVLERDGKIVGFMTCCPTTKTPDEFESWEKTTDEGTLNSTYDPNGKNIYVVTLSVLPEGSQGKDMLFANQIGKMLKENYKLGFFESRLPGLREWMVEEKLQGNEKAISAVGPEDQEMYAHEYFALTTEAKGKQVRYDRLIRLYERVGCKCVKIVPNAYNDEPSMNFGVVCVYDGNSLFDGTDLPVKLPNNRLTRWAFGNLMQLIAKSPNLTKKVLG